MNQNDFSNNLLLAGVLTASSPFQFVKTRLQTMPELLLKGKIPQYYRGVFDCLKNTVSTEGLRALWKGNTIGVMRFFPNQNINFLVKNKLKSLLPTSALNNIFSGTIAGWTAASILYPFDTMRIFLTTQTSKIKTGAFQRFANIYSDLGLKFFYQGFFSSLAAIAIYRGSYFGIYDTLKMSEQNSHPYCNVVSAYVSSLTANYLVYPFDTIRRKALTIGSKQSQITIAKKVIKQEGIRGIYRGAKLTWAQSIVGSCILMYFDQKQSNSN